MSEPRRDDGEPGVEKPLAFRLETQRLHEVAAPGSARVIRLRGGRTRPSAVDDPVPDAVLDAARTSCPHQHGQCEAKDEPGGQSEDAEQFDA